MRLSICVSIFLMAACVGGGGGEGEGDAPDAPGDMPGGSDYSGSDDSGSGSGSGSDTAPAGPYFTSSMFWNQDVSQTPKAANSATIISALKAAGGWGDGVFKVNFSIPVFAADASTPKRTFTKNADFYTPDCDSEPVPVPTGAFVEGNSGLTCSTGGDCHLLVYDTAAKKLYEHYHASITSSSYTGSCLAVWDTAKAYTPALRGDQCSSADAAGFPIAPLLFNADEVKAGHIDHAIRFVLPNDRVKRGYVRPATHGTNTTGGADAPYYGVHLRLRANYPVDSLPTEGARVVARTLQKYGMYHADGGVVTLTAQNDRNTTAKWSGLLGERDLQALKVEDFEVIDHGGVLPFGYNCARK